MKALDVDIASLKSWWTDSNSALGTEELRKYQTRRKDMEAQYDQFLSTLQVYDPRMTEEDRLVLRVARIFGECELAMPAGFVAEVKRYIKKWQSSALCAGDQDGERQGLPVRIVDELSSPRCPAAVLLSRAAGERLRPVRQRPPTR